MSTLSIILPSRSEPEIQAFLKEVEAKLPVTEIIVSNDQESRGKGRVIREALKHAKGDQIAFLDGDGEIPARMLLRLLPFLEDFDVVVGSKRITNAPLRRKIMTHVTRIWFRFLYGLQVDTQTGIKLFRREAILSSPWISDSFVFDVEVLYNIQSKGFRIIEVPIECEIRRQLPFKTIWNVFRDSVFLWIRLRCQFLKSAN